MNKLIALLEDDDRRSKVMCQEIAQRFHGIDYVIFDNAPDMIAWLKDNLDTPLIISLDHDLGANQQINGRTFDPGTGRDVVNFLASQKPTCPVIIHTTNHIGGDGMKYALEDAGWITKRVVPFDDFGEQWAETVKNLMEKQS